MLVWVTKDMLERRALDGQARLEAITDLLFAVDNADVDDFEPQQAERFHARRYEVGVVLGEQRLTDEAFEALRRSGSAAGYYLRAVEIAGRPVRDSLASDEDRTRAADAVAYLEEHRDEIKGQTSGV